MVTAGDGPRVVAVRSDTRSNSSSVCSGSSLVLESDQAARALDRASPEKLRRQVLLIGDSMGRCLPESDAVFLPVLRDDYQFSSIARDIVAGNLDIQYRYIIIWAGAHAIHHVKLSDVPADLKSLVNVIRNRNPTVRLFISSLLPKPRENHLTEQLMISFNRGIKAAISYIRNQGYDIQFLQSHLLVLDDNKQLLRPIIDLFEDGFHLNVHGAHKLRRFWLQQLGLTK